eukprot:204771-Ditylum_brightwellii.AAC.1
MAGKIQCMNYSTKERKLQRNYRLKGVLVLSLLAFHHNKLDPSSMLKKELRLVAQPPFEKGYLKDHLVTLYGSQIMIPIENKMKLELILI